MSEIKFSAVFIGHGSPMNAAADIPVLEMSLDVEKTPRDHYSCAKNMIQFRDRKIIFIGSGNLVHNLHDVSDADLSKYIHESIQNASISIRSFEYRNG